MESAIVTTKDSSLRVYSTSNASQMYLVGYIPSGSEVDVIDNRIVNNTIWVKVRSDNIEGWVIKKHPSISYSYLEEAPMTPMKMMRNSSNEDSGIAVVDNTDKTISKPIKNTNSKIDLTDNTSKGESSFNKHGNATNGASEYAVKNIKGIEVGNDVLSSIDKPLFSGYKHSDPYRGKLQNVPQIVQNNKGFPNIIGYNERKGYYQYDYSTDYSTKNFVAAIKDIRKSLNITEDSVERILERYSLMYNRFKIPTLDDVLTKAFGHVFFTRPDCNIIKYNGSDNYALQDTVKSNPDFLQAFNHRPFILMQLSQSIGVNHQFMMLPSNRVNNFESKDINLESDTYGKTYQGNTIAYAKTTEKSTASSEVSMNFFDSRNLDLSKMFHLWVEYISKVRKGIFRPAETHLFNKELDYASSAYYILTAENGEDIIFWTKLYGIFPTNVPLSPYSWQRGQVITNPELNVTFAYSFKRDWYVDIVTEFNMNSYPGYTYLKTYDKNIMSVGNTWVGAPFIETVEQNGNSILKLRFRKE